MIRQIAAVFFTMDIPGTLAYYEGKLGFKCLGTWQDPPVYAIVARDEHAIHFRGAAPPTSNPDKYEELASATVSTAVTRSLPAFSNGRFFFRENEAGHRLVCLRLR